MLRLTTSDIASDFSLNIDLSQKIDFTPKSESIKKYINTEIEKVLQESLQDDKDIEIISFRPAINYVFVPHFNNVPVYSAAGFSDSYLSNNSVFKDESFYLFDLYDSYVDANQTLISRNFLKMSKIDFSIFTSSQNTDISFDLKTMLKEYVNIYIPSYFMNTSADTFYFKISFFNATNGKLRHFECSKNEIDNLKNYFKLKLNKKEKTYEILNGDIITNFNDIRKTYKISEVIEPEKEIKQSGNRINILQQAKKTGSIITTRGKFL